MWLTSVLLNCLRCNFLPIAYFVRTLSMRTSQHRNRQYSKAQAVGNNFKTNEKLEYSGIKWRPKLWWMTYPFDWLLYHIIAKYTRTLLYTTYLYKPIELLTIGQLESLKNCDYNRKKFADLWIRPYDSVYSRKSTKLNVNIYWMMNVEYKKINKLPCNWNIEKQISILRFVFINYCEYRCIVNKSLGTWN